MVVRLAITQKRLKRLEKLLRFGTPLDPTIMREVRAACRGLQIAQTGTVAGNMIHARGFEGVSIIASVSIENETDEPMLLDIIRLRVPWLDGDYPLLEKLSEAEAAAYNGYRLSALGPYGFSPKVVLNHQFGCNFKLSPGNGIEGLLFGECIVPVPEQYPHRKTIPAQIIAVTTKGRSFEQWISLFVSREIELQRAARESVSRDAARTRRIAGRD